MEEKRKKMTNGQREWKWLAGGRKMKKKNNKIKFNLILKYKNFFSLFFAKYKKYYAIINNSMTTKVYLKNKIVKPKSAV